MNPRLLLLWAALALAAILPAEDSPVNGAASAPPVSTDEPAAAEPAGAEPAGAEPAVGDSAVGDSAVGEPAVGEPAVGEPAVGEPAVGEPAVGDSADEAPAGVEEDTLPMGFPVARYTAVWENSPFNREVIPAAPKTLGSSFAGALVLEGVINDDEKGPLAYVRDTREDKSLVITSAKSDGHPFSIVSAKQSNRPEETKITITDGNETGEIGFETAALTQAIAQPVSTAPPQTQGRVDPRGGIAQPNLQQGAGQVGGQSGGGAQPGGMRPGGNTPQIGSPATSTAAPASATPALDALDAEPRRRRVPLPGASN